MTLPCASFTVAERVVVAPATIEAAEGATVTVVTTAGCAVTVIAAVPDFPEHVAVIVADPAAIPETTPDELTVAAEALLVDHAIVWPFITLPEASFTVADKVVVLPATIDALDGATVTVVTTGGGGETAVTVTLDVPDFPDAVAVIVAVPAATPLTTPVPPTVATEVLLDVHVTAGPVITLPLASFSVA
jgi:hypothetical protein